VAGGGRTVESVHYATEFLKALVHGNAGAERQVFLEVVGTVESAHYRNEAVQALLNVRDLNESDLLALVTVISAIDGDHYKGESLQAVARHRSATDRVRTAVLTASERMSSHYREQVRRATGK